MVTVIPAQRKTAVLTPSSLACLSHIPTVNLTSGCAHGCVYCYTRGYSTYPGEDRITVYTNTLAKLRDELSRKRRLPRAVYFSPSSDLFQPVPQVLELAYSVLRLLLGKGIGVALLTKGRIPKEHMALLETNASQVRAQIGLITMDEELAKTFEPRAPAPRIRLAQAQRLHRAGVQTQVRLDPILPGLTDDTPTIGDICSAVAEIGVKEIAAATLFLRPKVVQSLRTHIDDRVRLDALMKPFRNATRLAIHARDSTVRALPTECRRAIYGRLERAARARGLRVRVCACKNPDLATGSCQIAGDWSREPMGPVQRELFPTNDEV